MKKYFILILIIGIVLSTFCCSLVAENNTIINDDLYSFIYTNAEDWEYFREEIIGKNNKCIEGFLYVKNMSTGLIKMVYNDEVSTFIRKNDNLFFMSKGAVYNYNLVRDKVNLLYKGTNMDLHILQYQGNSLYFYENGKIVEYNISRKEKTTIYSIQNVVSLYIDAESQVFFTTKNNEEIEYHFVSTDRMTHYSSNDEMTINQNNSSSYHIYTSNNGFISVCSENFVKNFEGIFQEYPIGSYFTRTGYPCDSNHQYNGVNNDKWFDGGKQCRGFAKYSCQVYNHCTSGTPRYSVEENENISNNSVNSIHFNSAEDLDVYFSNNVHEGMYVLMGDSRGHKLNHAILFVKMDNDCIYVYEANANCVHSGHPHKCEVTAAWYDIDYYYGFYDQIVEMYNIDYDTTTYYDSFWHVLEDVDGPLNAKIYEKHYLNSCTNVNTYNHKAQCRDCHGYVYQPHTYTSYKPIIGNSNQHKVCCQNSFGAECGAYIYENHQFVGNGSAHTCTKCGYTVFTR